MGRGHVFEEHDVDSSSLSWSALRSGNLLNQQDIIQAAGWLDTPNSLSLSANEYKDMEIG